MRMSSNASYKKLFANDNVPKHVSTNRKRFIETHAIYYHLHHAYLHVLQAGEGVFPRTRGRL